MGTQGRGTEQRLFSFCPLQMLVGSRQGGGLGVEGASKLAGWKEDATFFFEEGLS